MNTFSEMSAGQPESRSPRTDTARNARWLFLTSVGAVITVCVYYAVTSKVPDALLLVQGLATLVLAATPALIWAKEGGRHLPLFEVLMLTAANTFAFPLLGGHESLRMYKPEQMSYASFTVLIYEVVAIATYYWLRPRVGRTPFFTAEVIERDINRYVGYGLTLTTVYVYLSTFTTLIPGELAGIFRAVFSGVGLASVFVQSRAWGLGTLRQQEKVAFAVNIAVQTIMMFSTLFLVGGLSLLVLALLGYVSGSRKLPLVASVAFVLVLGVLHNGKSEMRHRYWDNDGYHYQPTLAELPGFYAEWLDCSFRTVPGETEDENITVKLLDRTSLFHLLLYVQSQTPERRPFLHGSTYQGIPAQFIPRFFWPDKPVSHAATYEMSIHYGLQRAEDTAKTTIGFGMLIEAFVNFGLLGVAVYGAFIGAFYKLVHTRCLHSPLLSYAGLFTIVLMAWSFQTEMPLGMWLSSMFQACVAVMGVPFLLRNILR